jgi:hypothetical protein
MIIRKSRYWEPQLIMLTGEKLYLFSITYPGQYFNSRQYYNLRDLYIESLIYD